MTTDEGRFWRQTVRQAPQVRAQTVVEPLLVQVLARQQRLDATTLPTGV